LIENLREAPQHRGGAISLRIHPINEIRSGQVQLLFGNGLAMMLEQALRAVLQQLFKFRMHNFS